MLINSSNKGSYILFDWEVNQDVTLRHLRYYPAKGDKDCILLPARKGYGRNWIHDVILSENLRKEILRICRERWYAAPAADRASQSAWKCQPRRDLKVFRPLLRLADAKDPLVGSPRELSEMCTKVSATDVPSGDIRSTLRNHDFRFTWRKEGAEDVWTPIYELPATKLREIVERLEGEERDAAEREKDTAPMQVKTRSLEMAEPLPEGESHDANLQ